MKYDVKKEVEKDEDRLIGAINKCADSLKNISEELNKCKRMPFSDI